MATAHLVEEDRFDGEVRSGVGVNGEMDRRLAGCPVGNEQDAADGGDQHTD